MMAIYHSTAWRKEQRIKKVVTEFATREDWFFGACPLILLRARGIHCQQPYLFDATRNGCLIGVEHWPKGVGIY